MIFRLASLLTVAAFLQLLSLSVKVMDFSKYYTHFMSTTVWDVIHGNEGQEYDFIVVGSGSAGSVLANRLSRHNKVLIIEAGGTPFYADHFPILAAEMLHRPETDYMYKTVTQKHSSLGMIENRSFWPRGKMLGGSSNLNYMMYVRAHPLDYDNWALQTKDESWNYKNLLPYFKRSINYNGIFKADDHNYGYLSGTQSVETKHGPVYDLFMEGGKELGFEVDIDLNGPQRQGFGHVELSQKQGKRETSYTAFLEPILDRENLIISKYSQAVKLKMDKSNKVVGVWYVQHGKMKFARASKEVIVSAGAVDSPKLMMLSGIGPKEHLQELGIKPKIDLPVGQNLKDHVMTFVLPITINSTDYCFKLDRDLGILDLFNYYWRGTGAFTNTLGSMAQTFFTSSLTKKTTGLDWTDFQMIITNAAPYDGFDVDMSAFLKIRREILQRLSGPAVKEGKDGFTIALTLGRPKSVGTITLESKDPSKHPIIDPNYLSHPDDISRYVEAVKFLLKIVEETKAFQKINATYVDFPIDECKQHKFRSDKYWECYLRHISMTMYHPVSTCKMGSGPDDKTSVVDSQLRVLHTRGLRIADCSVVPELMNGNTNVPAVMIGERGADIIRDHWSKQYSVCARMEIFYREWSHTLKCFYSRMV